MSYPARFLLAVAAAACCAWTQARAQDKGLAKAAAQLTPWEQFHQDVMRKASPKGNASVPPEAAVVPYGAIVFAARWPSNSIPVCWENPSPAAAEGMGWVRDAVARTWEAHSKVRFTGWQQCAGSNKGIRIKIAEEGPHVKGLGRLLDARKEGMVLNFTFAVWSPDCQARREDCIRSVAVHEFGHALAMTHEQNRPDAPGECKALKQGTDPDTMLTPYDKESVMNYCNKKWNNDGFLSPMDITTIQRVYP